MGNARYESTIKVVKAPIEALYGRLSDISKLGEMMPPQLCKDVVATDTECHFTLDKVGPVGFKLEAATPHTLVKYALDSSMPIKLSLYIQMKPSPDYPNVESRLRLTVLADIPMVLRPIFGKQLQEIVDKMADTMASRAF